MPYLSKIICMFISVLLSVGLPIFLLVFWRKRTKARLLPALIGALTFIIFALVLEQLLHSVVLVQPLIMTNTALYVLYAGLAAGVFEETGRLFAFRLVLRKYPEREAAVSYGIGHGGIEAILIVGINMLVNLVLILIYVFGGESFLRGLLPAGGLEELLAFMNAAPTQDFLLAGIERLIAVALHISLSVLVFKAVSDKKWLYYPLAILIHAAIDWLAALASTGTLSFFDSMWLTELVYAVLTAVTAWFAFRVYRKLSRARHP